MRDVKILAPFVHGGLKEVLCRKNIRAKYTNGIISHTNRSRVTSRQKIQILRPPRFGDALKSERKRER